MLFGVKRLKFRRTQADTFINIFSQFLGVFELLLLGFKESSFPAEACIGSILQGAIASSSYVAQNWHFLAQSRRSSNNATVCRPRRCLADSVTPKPGARVGGKTLNLARAPVGNFTSAGATQFLADNERGVEHANR